jgi:Ca2+-binding RTX toxin-like protein
VGTSGVDADAAIIYSSNVSIEGFGDNDLIGILPFTGQGFVSGFTVIGGQGDDTITSTAALVSSAVWGDDITTDADGNQVAGSGNDLIALADVQNSTVLGLGGTDTITTGNLSGADINGNEGIDTITVAAGTLGITSTFVRGGKEFDTINITAYQLVDSHINGNKSSDSINVNVTNTVAGALIPGAEAIISTTTVYGGQGDDTITATADAGTGAGYVISGDLGNDTISASDRKDTIFGGEGDDTITGGAQADTMTGGPGKNSFTITNVGVGSSFASTGTTATSWTFGDGIDIVTDFKGGADADTINADGGAGGAAITATSVRGSWNSGTGVFTVNAAGPDYLVATFAANTVDAAGVITLRGAAADDSIVLLGSGASAPVIV